MITILETIHGDEDPISIFHLFWDKNGERIGYQLIWDLYRYWFKFFFFLLRNDIGLKSSVYRSKLSLMVD